MTDRTKSPGNAVNTTFCKIYTKTAYILCSLVDKKSRNCYSLFVLH